MLKLIKKNISYRSGIVFFIIASLFLFLNYNFRRNKLKDISAYVVIVEKGFLAENINSSGEIRAIQLINISPKKQGFIKSLEVKEGDYVIKDQVLATLDDSDFLYKLEELKLQLEKNQNDLERREFLYSEGAISKEDLEEYRNKYEISLARFNDAETEKDFYIVKAPFSGLITTQFADIGAFVTPSSNFGSDGNGRNFIFELSEGIEIVARVPESDIGRIKIGQEAIVKVEAYPSRKYLAQIIAISPRALKDNNVTSFEVTLKFNEIPEEIKIGMTADLEFIAKDNEEKILVPTVSIVTENGKKGILIVDENNMPIFKEIEVGVSSGSQTSIISGIKEGEQIFIDIPPWVDWE